MESSPMPTNCPAPSPTSSETTRLGRPCRRCGGARLLHGRCKPCRAAYFRRWRGKRTTAVIRDYVKKVATQDLTPEAMENVMQVTARRVGGMNRFARLVAADLEVSMKLARKGRIRRALLHAQALAAIELTLQR